MSPSQVSRSVTPLVTGPLPLAGGDIFHPRSYDSLRAIFRALLISKILGNLGWTVELLEGLDELVCGTPATVLYGLDSFNNLQVLISRRQRIQRLTTAKSYIHMYWRVKISFQFSKK